MVLRSLIQRCVSTTLYTCHYYKKTAMSGIASQFVEYQHSDKTFQAYAAFPKESESVRLPCILIGHTWAGRGNFEEKKAEELARLGYVGFAVDVLGKGVYGSGPEENAKLVKPLHENRQLLLERLNAALCAAQQLPNVDSTKIAVIGYCFGGMCALDMARARLPIAGAVSFHGTLTAPTNSGNVTESIATKVLVLHGYDDPKITPTHVIDFAQEMTSRNADWYLVAYGHAQHAFTDPEVDKHNRPGVKYDKNADKRSWQAMQNFLTEIFQ